jgi:hypothetical protein
MGVKSPQDVVVNGRSRLFAREIQCQQCKNYTPMPFNAYSSPIEGSLRMVQDAAKTQ